VAFSVPLVFASYSNGLPCDTVCHRLICQHSYGMVQNTVFDCQCVCSQQLLQDAFATKLAGDELAVSSSLSVTMAQPFQACVGGISKSLRLSGTVELLGVTG
jgi:hypothetical protein